MDTQVIHPAEVWRFAHEEVSRLLPDAGVGESEWLTTPRPAPFDFANVVVRDRWRRPLFVFRIASPSMPTQIADAVVMARTARDRLPPALARSVLVPIVEGTHEGRSWAVLPYVPPMSSHRAIARLQRRRVAGIVLDWLFGIAVATCSDADPASIESEFGVPIERMREFPGVSKLLAESCERSARRLSDGVWRPRLVLAHNDIWTGNVLLPQGWRTTLAVKPEIRVIDWPAARVRGHAIYDLVRAAMSFGVSAGRLRLEVQRHTSILGCAPEDAVGHALAALGDLAGDLAYFSVDAFLQNAESCVARLHEALRLRAV